jgi:hypothetical protein
VSGRERGGETGSRMRVQHPGIRRIISGELAPDRAIATGMVEVLRGRADLLDRFASTFHLAA